jgi:hypothetical protein
LLHQFQKATNEMKTTTYIIAMFLSFQANFLFAGNDNVTVYETSPVSVKEMAMLAPVLPSTAAFEENPLSIELSPVTPAEANFEN